MGGPSSKEIQSDETLTKYIDGEITDALLLELFERQLSTDVDLQKRLQAQIAIKSQISSISGGARLRPTERVKLEIHNLVKNATKTETPPTIDDDGSQTISDAEMLIVKLIDDELNDNELRMVETLISQNDTYRELYEQLVTSKIHTSEYLFSEDVEPSNKVKMDIKSLISDTLSGSGSDGIAAFEELVEKAARGGRGATIKPIHELGEHPSEGGSVNVMKGRYGPYVKWGKVNASLPKDLEPASVTMDIAITLIADRASTKKKKAPMQSVSFEDYSASEIRASHEEPKIAYVPPPENTPKSHTNRFSSSLNYYAQRLVPLAAVFVVGLYISPTLFSTGTKTVPGVDLTLRGADTQTNLGEGLDFISVINEPPAVLFNRLYTPPDSVSAQQAFHFELTAPISGEMFIYLETSEHKKNAQLDKGTDPQRLGFVEAGQSVRYPATQNLSIDKTDHLLRVDIEIRGIDEVFNFTKFVSANHLTLEKKQ